MCANTYTPPFMNQLRYGLQAPRLHVLLPFLHSDYDLNPKGSDRPQFLLLIWNQMAAHIDPH